MSKFNVGDKVKVIQFTDLDADYDAPFRVIKDNETYLEHFGQDVWGPRIGDVGTVTQIWASDYYTVSVVFESDPMEEYSFIDDDLELVQRKARRALS